MTEDQVKMLRHLIQSEIEYAQIDGMEHGQWGWAEKQLDEGWKTFIDSFTRLRMTTTGGDSFGNV